MSDPALRTLTEEEYLNSELQSDVKREYVNGFVYAQAGASRPHNRIVSNIQRVLLNATEQGPCWSYTGDMRIRVSKLDGVKHYYPDLVVVCDPDESHSHFETRPCLLIEVLSSTTRHIDMTFKAQDYLSIPSLQGYLIVDGEARAAELYRKMPVGWQVETFLDGAKLPCVDVQLSLDEMYRGVNF